MIVCLSEFAGGRVITPDGPLEYSGGKVYINPLVPHGVEPSVGPRLVVVAYTLGFATELSVLDVHILLSLGFNVPVPYRPIPLELKPSVRALQARVQDEVQCGGVRDTGDALQHPCAAVEPGQELPVGEDGTRYFVCAVSANLGQPDRTSGGSPKVDIERGDHDAMLDYYAGYRVVCV